MTPEDQWKLLDETSLLIAAAALAAMNELNKRIKRGEDPLKAAEAVNDKFNKKYAAIMKVALEKILGEDIGNPLDYQVGPIKLSNKLWANSQNTSSVVQGIVTNHRRGFGGARELALELYEGYGFDPDPPLVIKKSNEVIPKFMRDELLIDNKVTKDLSRVYARSQVKALRTGNLKAAYTELLDAIEKVEKGSGSILLEKKLQVAYEEKMRYFANRIAITELQKAFALQQANEFMNDDDVEFLQWRLAPSHPVEDICDYFAGVNLYGLGPGIYPKALAPVPPAHPHCKCVQSIVPIFDQEGELIEGADQAFFNNLPPDIQRKIAGSQKKLDKVKGGQTAWEVHNAKIDPVYQVKTIEASL